jgi:hypothetical protein
MLTSPRGTNLAAFGVLAVQAGGRQRRKFCRGRVRRRVQGGIGRRSRNADGPAAEVEADQRAARSAAAAPSTSGRITAAIGDAHRAFINTERAAAGQDELRGVADDNGAPPRPSHDLPGGRIRGTCRLPWPKSLRCQARKSVNSTETAGARPARGFRQTFQGWMRSSPPLRATADQLRVAALKASAQSSDAPTPRRDGRR